MGQVIVLTSGKGGTGKTTSAATLGAALSLEGQKTVVIDLDVGLRKLDLVTGVSDRSSSHWGDVVKNHCSLEESLIPHPHYQSLFILPAPQEEVHQSFTEEELKLLYRQLADRFDFVLVDCPPGAEQGFSNAVCGADQALIVVQCEAGSVRDGDKIARLLTERGISNLHLIINRYQPHLVREGILLSIEQVLEIIKLPIIGIVHEDTALMKAGNTGDSSCLTPDSKGCVCFQNIAKRLLGQEVPLASSLKDPLLKRLKNAWKQT